MAEIIKDFYNHVVKKVSYWLPVLFFSTLAYGFSITNRTVSIDDLAMNIHWDIHQRGLSGMRWGGVIWGKLTGAVEFSPFVGRFIGLVFLILGATVMACILYYLSGRMSRVLPYTFFASAMVTYPLINEIWEYNLANVVTGGNILLDALVMLYLLTREKKDWKAYLLSGLILSVVMSSYETGAFAYVAAVCMMLFYKYCVMDAPNTPRYQWIIEGITFAIPLALSVVFRYGIGLSLIKLYHLPYAPNGDTESYWGTNSLMQVVKDNLFQYGVKGFVYFPIGVFVILALVFIIIFITLSIRKHRLLPAIMGVLTLASLFTQVLIQGKGLPYRNALTLTVFAGFIPFLLMQFAEKAKRASFQAGIAVLLCLLCWHQSMYLNQVLSLNNQRSDNEAALAQQIGYRLKSEYEDKPVVFVGWMGDLGDWITSRITVDPDTLGGKIYIRISGHANVYGGYKDPQYIETDVNSFFNWASGAFYSQMMIKEYFSYYGYDIQIMDDFSYEKIRELLDIAQEEEMKQYEIRDMGEYLIVYLGAG